jgi:hypothetical protein
MKRLLLAFGIFAILTQFVGCGNSSPAPLDGSNMPDEVKKFEDRKKEEMERKINAAK